MWAGVNGFLDDVSVVRVNDFEKEYLVYLDRGHRKLLSTIAKEKIISESSEKELKGAVLEFKKTFKN